MTAKYCVFQFTPRRSKAWSKPYSCHRTKRAAEKAKSAMVARVKRAMRSRPGGMPKGFRATVRRIP